MAIPMSSAATTAVDRRPSPTTIEPGSTDGLVPGANLMLAGDVRGETIEHLTRAEMHARSRSANGLSR